MKEVPKVDAVPAAGQTPVETINTNACQTADPGIVDRPLTFDVGVFPDCSEFGATDACRLDADGMVRADFPSPLSALAFLQIISEATDRERGMGWKKWDPSRPGRTDVSLRPGWRIGFSNSQDVPVESQTPTWVKFPLTDCDFVHRLLNRFWFGDYNREDHRDGPEDTMCSFGEVCVARAHLGRRWRTSGLQGTCGMPTACPRDP